MKNEDYPALYQSTNQAAIDTQKYFVRLNIGYLISTILGTVCSIFSNESSFFAISSAVFFLVGLFLLVIILTKKYENNWYASRAAAESIKTATWRFMMRAVPFGDAANLFEAKTKFRNVVQAILKETSFIAGYFGGVSSANDQITDRMLSVWQMSAEERKAFYVVNRIDEQRKWYSNKSSINKQQNLVWFLLAILFNLVAGILAVIRIGNSGLSDLPIDVFAVIAISSLSWMQQKRFQDLSSSYAMTAHEIGIIKPLADDIHSEKELSDFVIDAENAFSREHTQWVAKQSS